MHVNWPVSSHDSTSRQTIRKRNSLQAVAAAPRSQGQSKVTVLVGLIFQLIFLDSANDKQSRNLRKVYIGSEDTKKREETKRDARMCSLFVAHKVPSASFFVFSRDSRATAIAVFSAVYECMRMRVSNFSILSNAQGVRSSFSNVLQQINCCCQQ